MSSPQHANRGGSRGSAASRRAALERAVAALAAGAAETGAEGAGPGAAGALVVSEGALDALAAWIEGIVEWNARIDLTAARSDEELVDLMVADALVLGSRAPAGARFVDAGTGAGAPGLALAIVRPDLSATLVEPLDKRVAFLRQTIGALAWPGAGRPVVVRGRAEALVKQGRAFDVATSRATLPPPEWLALGAELAPRGDVWVLLAQGEPPELAGRQIASDVRYRWPLTGAERRAVRYAAAAGE